MISYLTDLIEPWQSLNVLVIGEAILDGYLNGHADRLCREAPIPVVDVTERQDVPGGAANTAANVASLGARTRLLSVIGQDLEGDRLQACLKAQGVLIDALIISPDRRTLAKQRVIADSHLLVRFDQGSTETLTHHLEQQLIDRILSLFSQSDAVIVSDYDYGIVTSRIIQTLAVLQAQLPRVLVIDSKRLEAYKNVGAIAAKPNYNEAIQLLGLGKQYNHRVEQIIPYGDRLLDLIGTTLVAVTLDTEGTLLFQRGQPPLQIAAQPAPSHQATGAGDTFVSALSLSLAAGNLPRNAATFAAAAAAVVVEQTGTTTCKAEELRQALMTRRMAPSLDLPSDKLIGDRAQLSLYIQQYRLAHCRIVFTNGCFDILHQGHVTYLAQAKTLGDILVVGVNTDESIRRLKGAGRPINPLEDRLSVIAALSYVDLVVPFAELTPHSLLRIVCPDVYTKGGDYTRETLPETELVEELGGKIVILPYLSDRSTTRLIHQIRAFSG